MDHKIHVLYNQFRHNLKMVNVHVGYCHMLSAHMKGPFCSYDLRIKWWLVNSEDACTL